jgi:hypothetical protein
MLGFAGYLLFPLVGKERERAGSCVLEVTDNAARVVGRVVGCGMADYVVRRTGQVGLVTPEAPGSWTLEMIDCGSSLELGLRSGAAVRSLDRGRSRNKSCVTNTNANATRGYRVMLVRSKVKFASLIWSSTGWLRPSDVWHAVAGVTGASPRSSGRAVG